MPHATANGVSLHYELVGPEAAPVVAFAHSIGATMAMWDAQVAALSGRYRCLRYDTRGHGGSEVVATPATVDDLADDLAGLLDALGIQKAHVVGLSLGGMTGQAFALRHPERLRRLALLATSAEMDKAAWRQRIETVMSEGYAPFIDGIMVPRWFTLGFAAAHPEVIAGFRARMMANDPRGYAACANVIATLDLLPRISGITAPTMIIVGAEDPATPVAMSEVIRTHVLHAEMVVIPGAAHIVSVEAADRVTEYLGLFLSREEPTATAGAAA
jgi:3-oxoadipate enol-lactonase